LLGAQRGTIVDIIGPESPDASTLYFLLNAVVTIPILYMISLDGAGFHHFGTYGLLGTDAALNQLVFAIVVRCSSLTAWACDPKHSDGERNGSVG
jgi:hypothetical protein